MSMPYRTCITHGTYAHWNSYRIVRESIEPIAHPISLFCLFLSRTICRSDDLDGGDDAIFMELSLYLCLSLMLCIYLRRCLIKFNVLKFQSIAFFWGGPERFATPCLLVATLSQVFHDFDTLGLVPVYSSCYTFLYMLYTLLICYGHCGVTTRSCGFASLLHRLC